MDWLSHAESSNHITRKHVELVRHSGFSCLCSSRCRHGGSGFFWRLTPVQKCGDLPTVLKETPDGPEAYEPSRRHLHDTGFCCAPVDCTQNGDGTSSKDFQAPLEPHEQCQLIRPATRIQCLFLPNKAYGNEVPCFYLTENRRADCDEPRSQCIGKKSMLA